MKKLKGEMERKGSVFKGYNKSRMSKLFEIGKALAYKDWRGWLIVTLIKDSDRKVLCKKSWDKPQLFWNN